MIQEPVVSARKMNWRDHVCVQSAIVCVKVDKRLQTSQLHGHMADNVAYMALYAPYAYDSMLLFSFHTVFEDPSHTPNPSNRKEMGARRDTRSCVVNMIDHVFPWDSLLCYQMHPICPDSDLHQASSVPGMYSR
jgi:homogentisate 1,2-dioxygenase